MAVTLDSSLLFGEACTTAEQFTKLYYECLDKKRTLLSKLYMDTAVLIWNGNSVIGSVEIQNFYDKLPSSEHTVTSLDAQPLHEEAIKGQNTVMIVVAGNVKFNKKPWQAFIQNFLVTAQETKWKVVSDCLRHQAILP